MRTNHQPNQTMNTTTYLPGQLARMAKDILRSEAERIGQPKHKLRDITWSIRIGQHVTLLAQGWIEGTIIESTMAI